MKLTCDATALRHALKLAAPAVHDKPVLTVLTMVRLDARDGQGVVAGDNLVTHIAYTIPAEVSEPGTAMVDGKVLASVITGPDITTVTLTSAGKDGRDTTVTAGNTRATLRGVDPADFPVPPDPDETRAFACDAAGLGTQAALGMFAALRKPAGRPVLEGVCWEIAPGRLSLGSADGFRMALAESAYPGVGADAPAGKVIVPLASMTALAPLLAATDGDVTIAPDTRGASLTARAACWQWATRLIDGTYPDLARIVRENRGDAPTVTLSRSALDAALRRVRIFARDNKDICWLAPDPIGTVVVGAVSDGRGDGAETIPATVPEGCRERITYNVTYLLELLAPLGADVETIELTGTRETAGIFTTPGRAGWSAVVMPMVKNGE